LLLEQGFLCALTGWLTVMLCCVRLSSVGWRPLLAVVRHWSVHCTAHRYVCLGWSLDPALPHSAGYIYGHVCKGPTRGRISVPGSITLLCVRWRSWRRRKLALVYLVHRNIQMLATESISSFNVEE
jgi:hypothetical protein